MRKPTQLTFDKLYDTLKPLDKLAMRCFWDDACKGIKSVVKTGYGNNSLTALSYAGLVIASQRVGEYPVVQNVTLRGVHFMDYMRVRTTMDELAQQLPRQLKEKLDRKMGKT